MLDRYGAVIFDFFGTLTGAVRRGTSQHQVARALGCDPTAFVVLLDRTYPARVRGELGDARTAMRRLAWRLGRSPTAEQVTEAVRLRTNAIRANTRLRPDAVGTLWTLQAAGLRVGLVSDCTDELPDLVAEMPVAELLDAAVFSIHLGVGKPAATLFLTASRRLGVAPSRCLYVGDGGGRELSGARAAGMTAVRLTTPDLAEHLVFDPEPEWAGQTVPSLDAVLDLAFPTRRRVCRTPLARLRGVRSRFEIGALGRY
jgi:putative hydrolase of the HAD superfamily